MTEPEGDDATVDATLQLAAEPGRLVFTYLPHVDFAAHVYGQASDEYGEALSTVTLGAGYTTYREVVRRSRAEPRARRRRRRARSPQGGETSPATVRRRLDPQSPPGRYNAPTPKWVPLGTVV